MNEIDRLIPHPKIQQVSGSTLGKSFWMMVYLYFKEPVKFKLTENWLVELPNGMRAFFPCGFEFDGASIPWFMRWLMTSFGPLLRAAIFHDFGYRYDFLFDWNENIFAIARGQKFYDDLFRNIIQWTTGLNVIAFMAWSGVRSFGSKAWKERRKDATITEKNFI